MSGDRGGRGFSFTEILAFVAALGIILGAGASVVVRQATQAADLEAYTQAIMVAKEVLEVRRVKGRVPTSAELVRYRSAIGATRSPSIETREARFRGTGLAELTVTVSWRSEGPGARDRRRVRLVSLARAG